MTKERLQIIGEVLRFITPLLIGIIGYVSIAYLSSIDKRFGVVDTKFDSFLVSYHDMDKRVDKLEYKVFGGK